MKLFSSSSTRGRRVAKPPANNEPRRQATRNAERRPKKKSTRKKKVLIVVVSILTLFILLGGTTLAVVRWQIDPLYSFLFRPTFDDLAPAPETLRPPIRQQQPVAVTVVDEETGEETIVYEYIDDAEFLAFSEEVVRNEDIFTFLLLGDDGGNTDTIMVVAFDVSDHSVNVVGIPRDTLVNVRWAIKKANSIRANMMGRYRDEGNAREELAMQATLEEFGRFLGFVPDFWITVNVNTFPRLVDAIGGVDFRVPRSITHSNFTVSGGQQRLTGRQAIHVLRYRGYADGDIQRMNVGHDFLMAMFNQLMANRDSIDIPTMADIFMRYVRTNIQLNHLIWFGREFLSVQAEDISFYTMPGVFENIAGGFYISVLLDEWLEMVNEKLNPFNVEITEEATSILTRNEEGRLFVTDGEWAGRDTWGANSRNTRRVSQTN